ncbi:uncharacterized protein LOC134449716 [Engraulis encrasicolus]|uniref:uncharacterized protein LOC134449716 n=1 Tax=Engraulis encrasicolus TaxID=184585 RepID=UPI002FD4847C
MAHGWCFLLLTLARRFHVVTEKRNWDDARQYCREEFTDLATVDNMADVDEIKSALQDAGVTFEAWIGLYGGLPKWRWSLADEGFYETNSTHPYVLVEEEKTWADAQRYCREKHTDLASVRNQAENDKIYSDIHSRLVAESYSWIGLFRDAWEWSDGSSSSFRHWAPGPKTGGDKTRHRVRIKISGLWNEVRGGLFRSDLICYEALPTVEVVSPQSPFYSGDVVTLSCDIPKYTGPHQYGWIKDNNTVPGKTNRTITINLPEDSGQYQCHRRRDGSSVEPYISRAFNMTFNALPTATVEVVSPPPFYSGDVVTLSCEIPEYLDWHQYVWLKDNSPVPGKTSQTIAITLPLEAGQYQCSGERNHRPMTSSVSSSVDINAVVKRTQIVRVEMEMASDVDVEDPDVQEAFLQQIEQRMKDKGLTGNVQLSWRRQPDGKVFHKKKEKRDEL